MRLHAIGAAGLFLLTKCLAQELPAMHWADDSHGRPFSKDPSVVYFADRFLLYYSLPPATKTDGWSIGVASSTNLTRWTRIAEVRPAQECDKKGLAAPAAWVHDGTLHLFYQTYGNGPKDAICHAWSRDGVHFTRDPENPVFAPSGRWTSGRAIDAEVCALGDRLLLYFATRDPAMKTQMVGVASAPLGSAYGRKHWRLLADGPVLKPELRWEQDCIEAPSVIQRDGRLWMFYAGAYNNAPQQIGVAYSTNGMHWKRLSDTPFLRHGASGSWNSSESGHPGVFAAPDGSTHLFYQGNNDNGKTWYLSRVSIEWRNELPQIRAPNAGP